MHKHINAWIHKSQFIQLSLDVSPLKRPQVRGNMKMVNIGGLGLRLELLELELLVLTIACQLCWS